MGVPVRTYAAQNKGGPLQPFEYDPGELQPDRVEIGVKSCGICHSDLVMLDNEAGLTAYPFVPGHEVVGTITAVGDQVTTLRVGQTVGLGWYSWSDLTCRQCMSGDHNLCPSAEATIVGRHGGFADRVRCQAAWAVPIPDGVDTASAGPLFCAGLTVFNPLVQFGVRPTDRVGVIGVGGLGHLALQFLRKWGCEVVAFTRSDAKRDEVMRLGAHRIVVSRDPAQLSAARGSLDFILSTVSAGTNWQPYFDCLAPKGRLHNVGALTDQIAAAVFPMIGGQQSLSGSPVGSPATAALMLEFCHRHGIAPVTEVFPMSRVNDAIAHIKEGKAHYRVVLRNDFDEVAHTEG